MPQTATAIRLNGQPMDVPEGTSIDQLLAMTQIRTKLVAVEINLEIVPRESHGQRILRAGDEVEVVTLVGGG